MASQTSLPMFEFPDDSNTDPIRTDLLKRVAELHQALHLHAHSYYVLDEPSIPDAEYDKLFAELQNIETAHPELRSADSPTQRVGGKPLAQFVTVRHAVPMLSILSDTTYRKEAAFSFDSSVRKSLRIPQNEDVEYCAELKFDGLAVNLRYEKGILVQASTRGDGETGEDVIQNIKTIKKIPLFLPNFEADVMEIRGEIYIRRDDFERYNAKQRELGNATLMNPRNGAAGSMRQLDSLVTASRPLSFFAYGIGEVRGWQIPATHSEMLDEIRKMTFPVCEIRKIVLGGDGLVSFYEEILSKRESLPFEIDGLVYKVNNRFLQEKLGYLPTRPNWAFAHKFEPEEKITRILEIYIQVGRTGKLTPVARLEPVKVGGVTVSKATLHNEDETRRKDVRVGDTVIVRRAGDVIPEVVSVVSDRRPVDVASAQPFDLYKLLDGKCPTCKSSISKELGQVNWRCTAGLYCSDQRKQAITHFAQRTAMDIDGLGTEIVDALVDQEKVKSPADLYKLSASDLLGMRLAGGNTLQTLSVEKLLLSISKSKNPALNRFIFGLGIQHVGASTAKSLASFFGSFENLRKTSPWTVCLIQDVGIEVATSIHDFFTEPHNCSVLNELASQEIAPKIATPKAANDVTFEKLLQAVKMVDIATSPKKEAVLFGIGDVPIKAIAFKLGHPAELLNPKVSLSSSEQNAQRKFAGLLSSGDWKQTINELESLGVSWDVTATKMESKPMSEKLKRILLSKSDFTDQQINQMSDAEGWAWLYARQSSTKRQIKGPEVCFTGFGVTEREDIESRALAGGLHVVTSVTKGLMLLVAGANAGPAKIEKARAGGISVLDRAEFDRFLETGEIPDRTL